MHRPESRTGSERAVKAVEWCEDEVHGDQAEGGQGQSKVEQTRVRVVQLKDEITANPKTPAIRVSRMQRRRRCPS